jgi:hypothetical protein
MIYGNLEEYPISGIFAVAERVACSTRSGVGPPIGFAFEGTVTRMDRLAR